MSQFKQQLEQAAEAYAEIHSVYTKEMFGNIVQDFKAGARWALQSEAMRQVEQILYYYADAENWPYAQKGCSPAERAEQALALLREMREGVE